MLIRFYMSPPANPGGLAYKSVEIEDTGSDSKFSMDRLREESQ
jgi:hypothetical protein